MGYSDTQMITVIVKQNQAKMLTDYVTNILSTPLFSEETMQACYQKRIDIVNKQWLKEWGEGYEEDECYKKAAKEIWNIINRNRFPNITYKTCEVNGYFLMIYDNGYPQGLCELAEDTILKEFPEAKVLNYGRFEMDWDIKLNGQKIAENVFWGDTDVTDADGNTHTLFMVEARYKDNVTIGYNLPTQLVQTPYSEYTKTDYSVKPSYYFYNAPSDIEAFFKSNMASEHIYDLGKMLEIYIIDELTENGEYWNAKFSTIKD